MTPCPPPATLEQVLAGALAEGESAELRAHLVTCGRCRDLLDRLSDDAELRGWTPSTRPADVAAEPRLARLIHDLCATVPGPAAVEDGAPQAEVPLAFLGPPRRAGELGTLGPYRVLARLGQGGMGIVLRGHDDTLDRPVAIKVLRPDLADPAAAARFLREARAAGRLQHDHIVRVHAVVSEPGQLPYLVMEYLAGETLADRLRARGRLAPAEAAALVEQAARALAAAHAAGLVHRDVKPSNLLIEAGTGRAKLLDFGLARLAERSDGLTQESSLAGTPRYMSPEQVRRPGAVDGRTDVYGLGVTLYEALTGQAPFSGSPARVLDQILHDEPVPPRQVNGAVPRDLDTVCLKAMAKESGRRYPTAGELADDLRRWQRGEPVRARPAGVLERTWRWCRRNPRVAAPTAALLLAVLGGLGAGVWHWHRVEAARRQQAADEEDLRAALKTVDGLRDRGDLALHRKDFAQAEDAYTQAAPILERLVREHPGVRDYPETLANLQGNLGWCYLLTGRLPEAQATFAEALGKYEPQPAASPATLGGMRLGVAASLSDRGQSDRALDVSGATLRALEDGPTRDHPAWLTSKVLCLLHDSRAIMLGDLGRDAEAAGEWDAALGRDDGEFRDVFTLRRAVAQARLAGAEPTAACREHHAAIMTALQRADARYFYWGGVLYESAAVCAWCSTAAAQDEKLAAADRQAKSEQCAAYAAALLKRAQAQNYFRVPGRIDRLATDRGFEPLRGRPDFQALLAALRQAQE